MSSQSTRYTDRGGVLVIAAAACMWGTWSIFIRNADVPARVSAPIVFVLMGLFSLPFVFAERRRVQWSRGLALMLLANAAFAAGNVVTYFAALTAIPVALAVLVHYLAPVLVALLAPVVEGERVPGAGIATLVATAGLVFVLEPWAASVDLAGLWRGVALAALSAVFFAGNVFVARRLEPRIGAARTMSFHALIAAVLLVPLAGAELASTPPGSVIWLALGALFPGALAGLLFVSGLGRIGSSRAAILAYLEPLAAGVVGWLAWGELLGLSALFGCALIVGAGVWINRQSVVVLSEPP